MDVISNTSMPGDSRLVQQLVYELKSQGIFDEFRKECISDVDTKPAYQNLRQRVEGSVTSFLKDQTWSADMNKNQVREQLRKNIYESGYLDTGVERIVDQVVNPKINTIFVPQVEDVVYRYLGIEKPSKEIKKDPDIADLLPTDLEAVSPESVQSFKMEEKRDDKDIMNDSQNGSINSKADEDESPPFEPLENARDDPPIVQLEENSVDSQLSGFSGLQSHESGHANDIPHTPRNGSQMDWSYQDSQDVSQNSSDSRQSLGNSDYKMEICEDSESKSIKSVDTNFRTENGLKIGIEDSLDQDHSMDNLIIDETDKPTEDIKLKEILPDPKKVDDNLKNDKKSDEKRSKDKKDDDRKKVEDKKSRSSVKHSSKEKRDEKYKKDEKYSSGSKDKDRSSSKHSSHSKDKSSTSSSTSSRDKEKHKEDKESKEKSNVTSTKDKKDVNPEKVKNDKEKYKSDRDKPKDKYKDKERDKSSKKDKDKSEKSKDKVYKDKEKTDKDKEKEKHKEKLDKDKNKEKSERRKKEEKYVKSKDKTKEKTEKDKSESKKSDKDKSDRHKEKSEHKEKDKTDKDKSRSSINKSSTKDKDRDSKSSSSSSKKDSSNSNKRKAKYDSSNPKTEDDSEVKTKKEKSEKYRSNTGTPSPKKSKRDVKSETKDDHYSFKDKKNDRRSFDRDSNDGHSSKRTQNFTVSLSEQSQQSCQDSSSSFSGNGSGDSRNSDSVEKLSVDIADNQEALTMNDIQKFKYSKPKFASNFEEARKIMKIRRQLALLEKQNKLSLAQVEIAKPTENGLNPNEYKQKLNMIGTENQDIRVSLFKESVQEVTNSDKENTDNASEKPRNTEKKGSPSPKNITEKKVIVNMTPEVSKSVGEVPLCLSPKKIVALQTTNLSKENWEALEARLAQEMSNLDYGSYESHYDDYDEVGYTPVVVSPRKNVVLTLAEDVKRKNIEAEGELPEKMDDDKAEEVGIKDSEDSEFKSPEKNIDIKDTDGDMEIKDPEEDVEIKSIEKIDTEQPLEQKLIKEQTEENVNNSEIFEYTLKNDNDESNETKTEITENLVSKEVGEIETQVEVPTECVEETVAITDMEESVNKSEEMPHVDSENLKQDDDISITDVVGTRISSEEIAVTAVDEKQIETVSEDMVVMNGEKETDVVETCEDKITEDLSCRFLSKPDASTQLKVQYLYKYIFKLEQKIERDIKASQNNFLPEGRGRKRKLNENVDLKNNNETNFEPTVIEVKRLRGRPPKANSEVSNSSKDKSRNSTDIAASQNFSLPLSPAESENSFDKKEEEVKLPKQKKNIGRPLGSKRLQRYTSEDLYKPRPLLGLSTRRSRGAKNI